MARFKNSGTAPSATEKREICILCKQELDVLWSTPINLRTNFIIGCGQLCDECYQRITNATDKGDLSDPDTAVIVDRLQNKIL